MEIRGVIFPQNPAGLVQKVPVAVALSYYDQQHERSFFIPQSKIKKPRPVTFSDDHEGSLIEAINAHGCLIFILSKTAVKDLFFPKQPRNKEPGIPKFREHEYNVPKEAIKAGEALRRAQGSTHYRNLVETQDPPETQNQLEPRSQASSDQYQYPSMSIRL